MSKTYQRRITLAPTPGPGRGGAVQFSWTVNIFNTDKGVGRTVTYETAVEAENVLRETLAKWFHDRVSVDYRFIDTAGATTQTLYDGNGNVTYTGPVCAPEERGSRRSSDEAPARPSGGGKSSGGKGGQGKAAREEPEGKASGGKAGGGKASGGKSGKASRKAAEPVSKATSNAKSNAVSNAKSNASSGGKAGAGKAGGGKVGRPKAAKSSGEVTPVQRYLDATEDGRNQELATQFLAGLSPGQKRGLASGVKRPNSLISGSRKTVFNAALAALGERRAEAKGGGGKASAGGGKGGRPASGKGASESPTSRFFAATNNGRDESAVETYLRAIPMAQRNGLKSRVAAAKGPFAETAKRIFATVYRRLKEEEEGAAPPPAPPRAASGPRVSDKVREYLDATDQGRDEQLVLRFIAQTEVRGAHARGALGRALKTALTGKGISASVYRIFQQALSQRERESAPTAPVQANNRQAPANNRRIPPANNRRAPPAASEGERPGGGGRAVLEMEAYLTATSAGHDEDAAIRLILPMDAFHRGRVKTAIQTRFGKDSPELMTFNAALAEAKRLGPTPRPAGAASGRKKKEAAPPMSNNRQAPANNRRAPPANNRTTPTNNRRIVEEPPAPPPPRYADPEPEDAPTRPRPAREAEPAEEEMDDDAKAFAAALQGAGDPFGDLDRD